MKVVWSFAKHLLEKKRTDERGKKPCIWITWARQLKLNTSTNAGGGVGEGGLRGLGFRRFLRVLEVASSNPAGSGRDFLPRKSSRSLERRAERLCV